MERQRQPPQLPLSEVNLQDKSKRKNANVTERQRSPRVRKQYATAVGGFEDGRPVDQIGTSRLSSGTSVSEPYELLPHVAKARFEFCRRCGQRSSRLWLDTRPKAPRADTISAFIASIAAVTEGVPLGERHATLGSQEEPLA